MGERPTVRGLAWRPSGVALVGRESELNQIQHVLDRLAAGEPQVVEIHGEPGIGKTRLLDELAWQAERQGIELAVGRATEYERTVPFGLLAEAFERITAKAHQELELDAEMRAAIGAIAPETYFAPPPVGSAGPERYRLHRAIRKILQSLVRPPGLAIVLDDLHWADEASLELVEHLLLNLPMAPLLIAVAYRNDHVPPGLPAALMQTRASTTRLSPAPLRLGDVANLMPETAPRRRQLLLQASGGNPLYLEALKRVDEQMVAALVDPEQAASAEMPRGLRDLLATELRSLTETQRLVSYAAAVAGDPAELDLVVRIAGLSEDDVFHALDELVSLGVIRAAGSRFSFRHPLVRAAAYQAAGPTWRISGHRAASEYLRAHGGPLSLRAHHAARGASYGDTNAAMTLIEAATAALDTAPATAAAWVRRALQVLPDSEDLRGRRVELLLALARALQLSGRLEQSREILHQVLGLAPRPRAAAVRYCVITERLLGRLDESKALLEAELANSGDMTELEVSSLTVEMAAVHMLHNDTDGCARFALEALGGAKRCGDRGQVAAATIMLALGAVQAGDVPTARERLASAVRLVDSLSDTELREHLHAVPPLAWVELHLEQYADGSRHVRRGLDIARSSGRYPALPYLFIVDSAIEARTGRLEQARRRAVEAREVSRSIGSGETLAIARTVELHPTLWLSGPEPALLIAGQLDTDGRSQSAWWAEVAESMIATVQLAAGQPGRCADHVAGHVGADLHGATGLAATGWFAAMAVAKAELGAHETAMDLADRAVAAATALGLSFQLGIACQAMAQVLAECDRIPESVQQARAAIGHFTAAGAPLHQAMASELAAEQLSACGDLLNARHELGLAKAGYQSCAAPWLSTRLRSSETRLGARAPRPKNPEAIGTVGALSGRELEIAELVAAGLTNREIAARLFLSPKTVEGHLARVFAKLGVKSRIGVAQRLSHP